MQTSENDRRQFLELMETHQGILHRICSLYSDGADDHQDLFQEILLQLWRSYGSFQGKASLTTWMYRVALNTALLARRRIARRPITVLDAAIVAYSAPAASPEQDDEIRLLHACIQQLPAVDRAIVLLYLEERSYDEIAEIVGLSRSNVSVRLVRLKQRLRTALEQRGVRKEGNS